MGVHERAVDLLENGARAQEDEAVVDEALRYILAVLKALPKVREALNEARQVLDEADHYDAGVVHRRVTEADEIIAGALALLPTESEASDER